MINEIIRNIKQFYRECDKPTFFFALAMANQVIGFTPGIPQIFIYGIMIGYALYSFLKPHSTNFLLMAFLLYVPIGLLVSQPDSVFKPWERYVLFGLMLASNSPLLQGEKNRLSRSRILKIILFVCAFLGAGSFVGRFIGINFGTASQYDELFAVGTFGGLTVHSMLLGPIAGVGSLFMSTLWYKSRKRIFMILAIFCLFSVMMSASRSALMAALAGNAIMLYKMSGTGSNFMKYLVSIIIVASVTFPIWDFALSDVIEKNNRNVETGSAISSREDKWMARVDEFQSSPVVGVGFASVDLTSARAMEDAGDSGVVETGSSWFCILSMTGLIGALLLLPVFFRSFMIAWKSHSEYASVIVGMLVLFYVHMMAEGYALAGGSFLAFCLWLAVGCGYDCKYYEHKSV